jgi:hypothetical protein
VLAIHLISLVFQSKAKTCLFTSLKGGKTMNKNPKKRDSENMKILKETTLKCYYEISKEVKKAGFFNLTEFIEAYNLFEYHNLEH